MKKIKYIIFTFLTLVIGLKFNMGVNALSNDSYQNGFLLDVARDYYTVDQIKKYIDMLSEKDNPFIQMHFTDDENVGIESIYLDQTEENAIIEDGNIYVNPNNNKKFLTYKQVKELMEYSKKKNVEFIPEIGVPAHMKGFIDLARIKFGDEYVSIFAKGTGKEEGNIDIVEPEADKFIMHLYDEYTEFFKDCNYFHIGFDEYTYRIDEKPAYINKLYNYLSNKGFVVRMWNDPLTKDNLDMINKNIEINFWVYYGYRYATADDIQDAGFKIIMTNSYYLFFVPTYRNTNQHDLQYTIDDIINNWDINKWDQNTSNTLARTDNILGSFICLWSDESEDIDKDLIHNQISGMMDAMVEKTKDINPTKYKVNTEDDNVLLENKEFYLNGQLVEFEIKDDSSIDKIKVIKRNNEEVKYEINDGKYQFIMPNSDVTIKVLYVKGASVDNPNTIDKLHIYVISFISSILTITLCMIFKNKLFNKEIH